MQRILSSLRDWPLHDTAASHQVEQAALVDAKEHALMQRAGKAVASLVRAVRPHARTAWIACGPGNNGGDGLEAAVNLQAAGMRVVVTLTGDAAKQPADARVALQSARAAGIKISDRFDAESESPDIAIDALLGLGSTRQPEGAIAGAIDALNSSGAPILAVDLPSGLNADTGQAFGKHCIVATHTLALLTLKPGLFTGSGRDLASDVWLDDLGTSIDAAPTAWLGAKCLNVGRRLHANHKGSFGDVLVVGGAEGMTGAALLAARSAHAAGAGRVYVELLDEHAMTADPLRPELMFRSSLQRASTQSLTKATVVCGCGGGDAVRIVLPRLLSNAMNLVLDADALNAVATDSSIQQLLIARSSRGLGTVLTPHPLEAARLLNASSAKEVQADRLGSAQRLAERFGCVVVLKGSGSVIVAPGVKPWINATGNASLATAGTGDVLAGWMGGCWSSSSVDALKAARHAVWLHGHAADRYVAEPLRAADLVDIMHSASAD